MANVNGMQDEKIAYYFELELIWIMSNICSSESYDEVLFFDQVPAAELTQLQPSKVINFLGF